MNAILFAKDGTTKTVKNVWAGNYLEEPIYMAYPDLTQFTADGTLPCGLQHTITNRRYVKQIASEDYAVFVEE